MDFMKNSLSKSIEELKKSDDFTDKLVNASREAFEELGTSENVPNEAYKDNNLLVPNTLTKFFVK